jgi:LacI family transcriptional regulator
MSERPTIVDVAREAGVSLMTVSRVVNQKQDVSQATRQKVLQVIDALGYRPSGIARGLATNRTRTLGIVVPDIDNPFFSGVVRGAENQAYAEGYSVFLCNTEENQEREISVLASLEEKQVDGLLLCSSRLNEDDLETVIQRFPVLVLLSRELSHQEVGTLLINDLLGGEMAASHLIEKGHTAIGLISGPQISHSGQRRLRGYHLALSKNQIPYQPQWVSYCPPNVEGGYQATLGLLKQEPFLTALICHNDLVAVGALQACLELGYQVPEDIAIMGYDDILIASLVTPALTTIHVPRLDLGAKAMNLLLHQINQEEVESKKILINPELIVRDST